MKNFTGIAFAFVAVMIFTGCSKFKEKKFDKTVNLEFRVDLTHPDTVTFDLSEIISTATGELEKHKDKIKSYRIKSMRYKIWEYWTDEEGEDVRMTAGLGIGNKAAQSPSITFPLADVSLLELANNPQHIEMNFSPSELSQIEQFLLSTNGLRFWATGSTSSAPAHFVLQVVLDVEAVAEIKS